MSDFNQTGGFLERVPLFISLQHRQLETLARRFVERQFASGEAMVRGVIQPIAVYRPVTVKAESDRLTRSELIPDSLPLLGRESEFHALKQSVEHLFKGRGRVAILTGDKGIGKTFLVNEVREYLVHRGALLAEAP